MDHLAGRFNLDNMGGLQAASARKILQIYCGVFARQL